MTEHPTRRLPAQPNLEQLRKQAKDLLAAYRSADPVAVEEVQRFEHHPDVEAFSLHDAQRVLARAYGYLSWGKLKAFVDGANVHRLAEAVNSGDAAQVRVLLQARPELIGMDMSSGDEHRALHFAVLRRDVEMVRLLMEAGADARKGIYPHRDATTAYALAKDRGYADVLAVIEAEEQHRREELSCPNATVSTVQEQINAAIARGDRETAMRLLREDGSLIQACDRAGGTPLHTAAEVGDQEMVVWLLDRRANVRKEDIQGFTPLDRSALAVPDRFAAVARRLLAGGAEETIGAAVALGNQARVRELIQANPGLLREIRRNGGLLTLAVRHGQLEMGRLLLDLGADVDERVMLEELEEPTLSWGMPLWHAALAGQRDMVELLLDRGADPNANVYASGWPLRNAWDHEDDSVKRLLLDRGANRQPYMVAEAHDVQEARRLLEADTSEETARELVWSAADHGCPEIVALALPRIPLPLDGRGGHWVLMQPIRGAGGGDNQGFFRSMDVLLRGGVDPNSARFGQTVLHFAAAHRGALSGADRARFAGMLIDAGARLDVRDDLLKSTPLGWACRWGRTELVELLLVRGAPVQEADAEAWAQPRAWAEKTGHPQVLALLQRFSG